MLIFWNPGRVRGQRKFGNPCCRLCAKSQ